MLCGYRMLDDWDSLVLVDETYEGHSIILMNYLYTPPIWHAFWLLHGGNQSIPMPFCP
jgi:hypothetical protein